MSHPDDSAILLDIARAAQLALTFKSGMRDKLIHEYDVADIEEVWNTLETDIPQLLNSLKPLLPNQK